MPIISTNDIYISGCAKKIARWHPASDENIYIYLEFFSTNQVL